MGCCVPALAMLSLLLLEAGTDLPVGSADPLDLVRDWLGGAFQRRPLLRQARAPFGRTTDAGGSHGPTDPFPPIAAPLRPPGSKEAGDDVTRSGDDKAAADPLDIVPGYPPTDREARQPERGGRPWSRGPLDLLPPLSDLHDLLWLLPDHPDDVGNPWSHHDQPREDNSRAEPVPEDPEEPPVVKQPGADPSDPFPPIATPLRPPGLDLPPSSPEAGDNGTSPGHDEPVVDPLDDGLEHPPRDSDPRQPERDGWSWFRSPLDLLPPLDDLRDPLGFIFDHPDHDEKPLGHGDRPREDHPLGEPGEPIADEPVELPVDDLVLPPPELPQGLLPLVEHMVRPLLRFARDLARDPVTGQILNDVAVSIGEVHDRLQMAHDRFHSLRSAGNDPVDPLGNALAITRLCAQRDAQALDQPLPSQTLASPTAMADSSTIHLTSAWTPGQLDLDGNGSFDTNDAFAALVVSLGTFPLTASATSTLA